MTGDQNATQPTCSNVDSTTTESLPGLGQLYETELITFYCSMEEYITIPLAISW